MTAHLRIWLFSMSDFALNACIRMRIPRTLRIAGSMLLTWACLAASGQSNEWIWMSGSSGDNQAGVYGTPGVSSPSNMPGSRRYATSWTDSDGNFWLFGGDGYDSTGNEVTLNDLWEFSPSSGEWTWRGGSSTVPCLPASCLGVEGVYGTPGVPDPGNFPGGRTGATGWTDNAGNLWLFGGDGTDSAGNNGFLNDVWEYSPKTDEWAWMGGSNVLTCVFELGGYCTASSSYGTLGTPEPDNIPGGRFGAVGWADTSGNLWLFGGETIVEVGVDTLLNDLWEFNPSTNEWVWMGGTSAAPCPVGVACTGVPGIYGTLGVPDAADVPGARYFPAAWTDTNGNFWLFGGEGIVGDGGNILNDLWEFNPSSSKWTWMGGSDRSKPAGGTAGSYGTEGVAAPGNTPGSRWWSTSWADVYGNFWLMGGWGYDAHGNIGYLNDLWVFSPESNEWTWVSGANTTGSSGVYGDPGVADADAVPGARGLCGGWADKLGNLWLFGGSGRDAGGASGHLNDLWIFHRSKPKEQRISFAAPTVQLRYGMKPYGLSARSSSGLPVILRVISGPGEMQGTLLKVNGAGTIEVVAIQAGNLSYAPAPEVKRSISVVKAKLDIAADNATKVYGSKEPAFTYKITGFVGVDTEANSIAGEPKFTTSTTLKSPAGEYPIGITTGTLSSKNYAFAFQNGKLTVTPAKLTVSARDLSTKQGSKIPKLQYGMTGFVLGDTQATQTTGEPRLTTNASSDSEPGRYLITTAVGTLRSKNYVFKFENGWLTITQ